MLLWSYGVTSGSCLVASADWRVPRPSLTSCYAHFCNNLPERMFSCFGQCKP